MSKLYPKYNPETYFSRDIFAKVCATGDLRHVWARVNAQQWGVDYEEFLAKCKHVCPCCGVSKLDFGLGKNNHGKTDEETPSTDHMLAKSKGGTNDIDNLWVICMRCNRMKNDADERDIPRIEGVLKVLKEMQERTKNNRIDTSL
jgi:5-methylcytosine-specific restriction endonuclease McrA